MHPFHTIIEPFRIKSVETWKFTTRDERVAALDLTGFTHIVRAALMSGGPFRPARSAALKAPRYRWSAAIVASGFSRTR